MQALNLMPWYPIHISTYIIHSPEIISTCWQFIHVISFILLEHYYITIHQFFKYFLQGLIVVFNSLDHIRLYFLIKYQVCIWRKACPLIQQRNEFLCNTAPYIPINCCTISEKYEDICNFSKHNVLSWHVIRDDCWLNKIHSYNTICYMLYKPVWSAVQ